MLFMHVILELVGVEMALLILTLAAANTKYKEMLLLEVKFVIKFFAFLIPVYFLL